MTRAQRKAQLISDFFDACHQGKEQGVNFIGKHIFQETLQPPQWMQHGNENIVEAVGRKYTELDNFAIEVDNFLRKKPSDSTPLNITTAERVEGFKSLYPEIEGTLYDVFKEAGHRFVIPLLKTAEYQSLKSEERAPSAERLKVA